MSTNSGPSFPLLALPPEIRAIILKYLLGGSVLHLGLCMYGEYTDEDDPDYRILRHLTHLTIERVTAIPESDPHKVQVRLSRRTPEFEHSVWEPLILPRCVKHDECEKCISDRPIANSVQRYYGILRSCRQLYLEASVVLFSSNVFSFSYAEAMGRFIRDTNPHHLKLITAFQITETLMQSSDSNPFWVWPWDRILRQVSFRPFGALRVIYLDITSGGFPPPANIAFGPETRDGNLDKGVNVTIKLLQTLEWLVKFRSLRFQKIQINVDLHYPGDQLPVSVNDHALVDPTTTADDIDQAHPSVLAIKEKLEKVIQTSLAPREDDEGTSQQPSCQSIIQEPALTSNPTLPHLGLLAENRGEVLPDVDSEDPEDVLRTLDLPDNDESPRPLHPPPPLDDRGSRQLSEPEASDDGNDIVNMTLDEFVDSVPQWKSDPTELFPLDEGEDQLPTGPDAGSDEAAREAHRAWNQIMGFELGTGGRS